MARRDGVRRGLRSLSRAARNPPHVTRLAGRVPEPRPPAVQNDDAATSDGRPRGSSGTGIEVSQARRAEPSTATDGPHAPFQSSGGGPSGTATAHGTVPDAAV